MDGRLMVLEEVARVVCAHEASHPIRVGIDGICGAGKTTFAAELADRIEERGRPAIHLKSDGFHNVREVRYRRGRESARGYYEDAYDFEAVRDFVLAPFGPGGSREYAVRVHDLETDSVRREWAAAPGNAVVIFAATFLQRDGLRELWDEVIYLDSTTERAQERGIIRDADALGGLESAQRAYESRYMAACAIYLGEQDPRSKASIVIDHDDPRQPRLIKV
jgi:uridine kinase